MRTWLAAAAFAALWPAFAAAQTTSQLSTPVVIHAGEAGGEGVITVRTTIVQRQRATTIRSVALDDAIATPTQSGRQAQGFAAGEQLFGIYDEYNSWAYCALRRSWWSGDTLTCYEDTDNDGKLDLALPSGAPFNGIPFFVFPERRETRALQQPARFHRIPYAEGPAIEAALQAELIDSRRVHGVMQPARISLQFGFLVNNRFVGLNSLTRTSDMTTEPVTLEVDGSRVEFSGTPERGSLHYRVLTPMPARIERILLRRTYVRTTSYTYIPIYIPR